MKPNLPSPFVDCEMCNGKGEIIHSHGDMKNVTVECPACKGRGWFLRRMTPADWLAETGREYVCPVWIYFSGDCWHSAHWALEEDPRWAWSIFEQEDILIAWPGFGPPDGEEWEEGE